MSIKSKSSTSSRSGGYDTVAVRMARSEDQAAIQRVAALDSSPLAGGPHLVAEADGRVIAALAIPSGHAVADPFAWTADVVDLMNMRAAQIRRASADVTVAPTPAVAQQLRTQLT